MRNLLLIAALVALMATAVFAGDEKPWFDMENCGYCKHLATDMEMLNNTTWEHHKMKNGLVSVTTVMGENHLTSYMAARDKMSETGKKAMSGETVPMCGMCTSMSSTMMKGMQYEMFDTKHGAVVVFTSDNPELVAEIHAWADKTTEGLANMEKEMSAN